MIHTLPSKNLSLITKCSKNQFANINTPKSAFKDLCYIPDWFIKRDNIGSYDDFIKQCSLLLENGYHSEYDRTKSNN